MIKISRIIWDWNYLQIFIEYLVCDSCFLGFGYEGVKIDREGFYG